MGIIKNELNKQIQANNLRTYSDTTGTILEYDHITNRAKIMFNSPIGEGVMIRENVPITSQSGGFTQCGIQIGAQCNIAFSNNNMQSSISLAICAYDKYLKGLYGDSNYISPLYLRKSQAERAKDGEK